MPYSYIRKRTYYLAMVLMTIGLGLLSRKISFIPPFIGDSLYALMMLFVCQMLFPKWRLLVNSLFSLSICYFIELSQLLSFSLLNQIRATLLGRLILGQGFLVSDLFAYFFGIVLGFCLIKFLQHFFCWFPSEFGHEDDCNKG